MPRSHGNPALPAPRCLIAVRRTFAATRAGTRTRVRGLCGEGNGVAPEGCFPTLTLNSSGGSSVVQHPFPTDRRPEARRPPITENRAPRRTRHGHGGGGRPPPAPPPPAPAGGGAP